MQLFYYDVCILVHLEGHFIFILVSLIMGNIFTKTIFCYIRFRFPPPPPPHYNSIEYNTRDWKFSLNIHIRFIFRSGAILKTLQRFIMCI